MQDGMLVMQENGQPKMAADLTAAYMDIVHTLNHPYDEDLDYGFGLMSGDKVQVIERASIPGMVGREVSLAIGRLRKHQRRLGSQLSDKQRVTGVRRTSVTPLGLGARFSTVISIADRTAKDVSAVTLVTNNHLFTGLE